MSLFSDRRRQISDLPAPVAFVLALVLSLLTCAGLVFLKNLREVNETSVALMFLLPVGISATFWGLFPGLTAAATSFLAFNYYFIAPIHQFAVHKTEDLVVLAAFLAVAVTISELAAGVKRNLDAAIAREWDATRLYDLSITLARSRDEKAVVETLMEKTIDTFQADRVEIGLEASPEPIFLARGMAFTRQPDLIAPLQTARGLTGEIRLWQQYPHLQAAEERILQTFASQSVLAIERVRLANADRKAQVLEESDRLKSSLLSSVSHELRSPLAAIKASVSSLRAGAVDWDSEARTDLLATVEEEIDHLNVLVGNLLDMSRIEAGVLKPQKKPNMLSEIVGAVTTRMRKQLQNNTLNVDVPDDLPLVNVDYIQIGQVFTNLLTNSLKYSPPNSTIQITAKQTAPGRIKVTVRNQSMPLPEADLDKIFDKFYRINPSEQLVGSGLGLSICKGIVEAHGGKIWAENVPAGTAFNFTLPINP
jgi:two-component system, OmpR family, sensor histidine kinase KdpD